MAISKSRRAHHSLYKEQVLRASRVSCQENPS